jgi:exopolyphosphatase / guanosine-5'-triphosphate,3'-diphosphate pyrophosphatase
MILSGAILLQECMNAVHAEEVIPTEFTLRDGVLEEAYEILKRQRSAHQFDVIADMFKTAKALGMDPNELKQSQKIAEDLFNLLKPVHHLDPKYKIYFIAAALLANTGSSVSPIDAEAHSAYIARFADIPVFENWESRMISDLCLHHRDGKLERNEIPFRKDAKLKKVFLKLLALLRISAALSFQRSIPIHFEGIKFERTMVRILVSKRSKAALALLRAEYRKSMFEEVFKKQLVFELV